jgi:TetR/AcrR family transcriptional repressor of nem operon
MRVTRAQMSANRARILKKASRLFRERGFAAVTIADVMTAAGQTHGGFYGHFPSKDALIAAVIAEAMPASSFAPADLEAWIDAYLSPAHRDAPATGCPTASLAGLMRDQTDAARAAMAQGLEAQIARMANANPEDADADRRRAAIGQWSAMVGALVMARAIGDGPLSDEILSETRAWLRDRSAVPA